jgi:hypothetical protein
MAQQKTCARLKKRRIPKGHSSLAIHYVKSKQTQQPHNLKNQNLASSTQKCLSFRVENFMDDLGFISVPIPTLYTFFI